MSAAASDRGEESQPLWLDHGRTSDEHMGDDHREHPSEKHVAPSGRRKMLAFLTLAFLIAFLSLSFILSDWSYYAATSDHKSAGHDHDQQAEPEHDMAQHTEPEPAHVDTTVPSAADLAKDFILDPNWDFNAPPQLREYDWTVKDVRHNPDGVFRQMMLVNEQYPGPLIEVNEGDTIRVHVTNLAKNATSIHWHGLYQNGTNHMDGTVGITQCPIAPGKSFTYEFKVAGQSGTYWWHAHQGLQSADGLHGPLIIHSKDEKTKLQKREYASDRVIMVSDYYHDPTPELLMTYLKSDRENVEPVPDGALINGHGKRDCAKLPHRECDSAVQGVGLPRIDLQQGEGHRLRIINVGTFAEIQVSLDEHSFDLTEVDGTDVEPASFERLSILPAQRYSIVLGREKARSSYWLRAKMLTACFQEKNKFLEADTMAIVNTIDGPSDLHKGVQPPSSKDWDFQVDVECRDMNTTGLVPVLPVKAPAKADKSFYLRSNFEIHDYRLSRGFFNTSTFRPDLKQPSLLRAIDGLAEKNASFTAANKSTPWVNDVAFRQERELVIQTKGITTVDLLVGNFDDGSHPFHLHGYKFFVLAQGHGYPPEDLASTVSIENPLRRDTATVEHFGWGLFRIVADNPGMWAFHCHVGWHSEAGLMMQLLTRTDELSKMNLPAENRALCDAPLAELQKGSVPPDEAFMVD